MLRASPGESGWRLPASVLGDLQGVAHERNAVPFPSFNGYHRDRIPRKEIDDCGMVSCCLGP